jgi:hypothetical protein
MSVRWQVHVYGDVPGDVRDTCQQLDLELHGFAWQPAMGRAGLRRGALYLVRPDGYVALADAPCSVARLREYLATTRIAL